MAGEPNVEISKEGIKIAYRRFLSDSAPGYILMLLASIVYYSNFPVLGFTLRQAFPQGMLLESKVFILLLLFLLATPLGLVINVFSWMSLEWLQKLIEKLIYKYGVVLRGFKEEYLFAKSSAEFSITTANWFDRVRVLETALSDDDPGLAVTVNIDPLRGITILLRNLSFLLLLAVPVTVSSGATWQVLLILLLASVVVLGASAITSFYFHAQIIYWSYLVYRRQKDGLLHTVKAEILE